MYASRDDWIRELASHDELFFPMFDRLPREMPAIRDLLLAAIMRSTPEGAAGADARPR